jgi:hypothetical protein
MKSRKPVTLFGQAITTFVFVTMPFIMLAQPTGGGPGGTPPPVPITGIEILLAAGAAFGAKKAYDIYRRRGK